MRQKTLFNKSALAVAVTLFSTQAWCAGFQLNEFSASGLGRGYSGEGAIADDVGNVSRNPALITLFDRPTLSAGAVFIDPNVNIKGRSPSGSSLDADNIAPTAWVPNLHFAMPVNERFGIGVSTTSNYGLSTEYSNNYAAGSMAGKTDLLTANLNLSGAYRLNDQWSFGLGFNTVYGKAKLERYMGDLGQLAPLPGLPQARDTQILSMKGDAWGFGWNAGILYELDKNNRYGLTYRSDVKLKFDGDYKSALVRSNNPVINAALDKAGLPYGTAGKTIDGTLDLHLPEVWEVSGYNRVAPQWAVHYSLTYTGWHKFKELRAKDSSAQTLFHKDESFHDAWRIALGTTYYYDDNWTFRTGIAFDDSPVPADKRTISIPDQDRLSLSAGATYAFNKDASVDVGISYLHGQKVSFDEGPYHFESEGTAWLYGMNFNYAF